MSFRKKALFACLAFVLLAVLGLGALELGLRLAGYGYQTTFFREQIIQGKPMLVENDKFGLRFFPPEMARSPAPVVMEARKAPGTYRIFIFGESAALGDPKPAFGPGRCLEQLLKGRFPNARFEVVCTAMTAINSHAILSIARECARHDGDLWLIYMGNNEMVGPFGAVSVFGARAPSLVYTRFLLAAQKFRVGQWLMATARRLTGRSSGGLQWEGMHMFVQNQLAPDDPRKEVVYRSFSRNLDDILRVARRSGARVFLNTVAVNIRDCAPFASYSSLEGAVETRFRELLTNGTQAEDQGDFAEAVRFYRQAAELAPSHADAQFRLGTALLRAGDAAAARRPLERARDLDALPFRADSRVNAVIQSKGKEHATATLALFDADLRFRTNAPSGLAGDESFYEHVHFQFDGNYLLARSWAEQIAPWLPAAMTDGARESWLTQDECERKLGLTDWNREAVLVDVLRRMAVAPFLGQSNHDEQVARLRARLVEIRKRLNEPAAAAARKVYEEAIRAAPGDHRLRENYAEFLEATGQAALARAEWERVRDLLPHHHVAYYHCGRLAMLQGDLAGAETNLTQAVTLRPDLAEGWLSLGQLEATRGNHLRALALYERERVLAPKDPRAYYHMGRSCSRLGRRTEAIAHFREAVRLRPTYLEAMYMLGEELAFDGQVQAARQQFEQVLKLNPAHAMAHFNLGVALWQANEREAAVHHFRETVRLDPTHQQAAEYLARIGTINRPQ